MGSHLLFVAIVMNFTHKFVLCDKGTGSVEPGTQGLDPPLFMYVLYVMYVSSRVCVCVKEFSFG